MSRLRLSTFAFLLSCLLPLVTSTGAHAGISGLNADDVPWQHLHYKASRGIATLKVDIDLVEVAPSIVAKTSPASQGLPAFTPPPGPVYQLQSMIELGSLFGTYRTDDRVWLTPGDIGAIEREKVRSGTKHYIKRFRYDANHAYRLRIRPDNKAQSKLPPPRWTSRKRDSYGFGPAAASCPVVSEPGTLFYLAGAHDFSNGAAVDLCVFSDSALFRMRVQPIGEEHIDVDYQLTENGKTRRVKGSSKAIRLRVTPTPLAGASPKADFEILDFKGSQDLLVDPSLRIPLRIEGTIPGMGRGNVDISAVKLRR